MSRVRLLLVLGAAFLLGAALPAATAAERGGAGRRGFGMMGARGSLLGLLRVEAVQKELKLTDEQTTKVTEIAKKLQANMREQYAGLRDIEDREERRAKMTALAEEQDAKAREQLRDVLEREQMRRLYQIRLQVSGPAYAMTNKRVAGRLKITPEQMQKAAAIEKETRAKTSKLFSGLRDLSQEERRAKMAEMRETMAKIRAEANEQVLKLLTAEQRAAYDKMLGAKFEMPARRGRG